ncbi:MAG: OmpA family protein [Sandaracinaceae bacterium]
MRLTTTLWLTLALTIPAFVTMGVTMPSSVAAQDEFDEFDDDFDEPEPEPESDDEFDDLEDDAMGVDDEDDALDDDLDDEEMSDDGFDDDDLGDEDEDDAEEEDRPSESEVEAAQAYRERRHILGNTWGGTIGGIHVADAGSGAAGAFRAQLGLDFFFIDGWLTLPDAPVGASDSHSHIGGSLSLSWNPWDFLEIYASIASWANSNEQESPALFQVLGDTLFGVKGYYHFEDAPVLTVGGDLSIGFLNTVGDIGLVGESTSVGIRGNLTADLRELEDRIPFIARLNLGYWFDNSSALVNDVERARYNALTDARPCPEDSADGNCQENRHLLTRVERYSLQIDRVDRFRIAIGVEAPLKVMDQFFISPIAEWALDIPVNRQGFSCLFIPGADPDSPAMGEDGCLDRQGGGAFEQTLTLGVRVAPPLRGLNMFVAVDIGLTGTNTFVRELSGTEPYNVRLGFGYAFDTLPVIQEVEREVVREVVRNEAPITGHLIATVLEEGAGTPVVGATVLYPGRELSNQSTGDSGRVTSYALEPGLVEITLAHSDYRDGACSGEIPEEGGDVEITCELVALPRLGTVRGTVTGEGGSPVGGASVQLSGPASRTIVSGPDGVFQVQEMPPGTYQARVEAENYLIKVQSFEVEPREQATPDIQLIARPRRSLVQVQRRAINIRRQVNFATDSAEILDSSTELLSEVADVIMRNPQIQRIEIQGHTDNRGGRTHNQDLSQRRAEAVRDWLVRAGVAANILEGRGYGQDDPIVPNITASNRARNRRVQFVIRQQADPE